MPAIAFYLDAPLQSWGASSKFQYRETGAFPSKSAVVGLVAAALGIDKHAPDEAERLAPVAGLRFTAVKLPKAHPARAKKLLDVNRLTDFHTIGGGYTPKDSRDTTSWEAMMCNHKASGGIKKSKGSPGTVITRRSYLTDAAFAAILEGSDEPLLTRIRDALLNPVWGVWFGRKTCLPATPLTPTLASDREAALQTLLTALPGREPVPLNGFEYQEECATASPGDGSYSQSDQPIAFGQHHGPVPAPYRARTIRPQRPSSVHEPKSGDETTN